MSPHEGGRTHTSPTSCLLPGDQELDQPGRKELKRENHASFSSPVNHPDEGVPLVEEGVEHVHVAGEGVLEAGLVLAEEHQRPGQLQEAEQDGEQGQVATRPSHTHVSTIGI